MTAASRDTRAATVRRIRCGRDQERGLAVVTWSGYAVGLLESVLAVPGGGNYVVGALGFIVGNALLILWDGPRWWTIALTALLLSGLISELH